MSVPFFAKALFDYEAVEESELAVATGDFLTVEEVNESGWCLARKGDLNGWLPTDYVQRIENDLGAIEPIQVSKPAHTREIVATEATDPVPAALAPAQTQVQAPAPAVVAATTTAPVAPASPVASAQPSAPAASAGHDAAAAAAAVQHIADSLASMGMADAPAPAAPPAAVAAPPAAVAAPSAPAAPVAPSVLPTGASIGAASAPAKAPTHDASGAPLKVCAQCHEGIRSAFVMARGLAFHPNHFQCHTCRKELGGRAYMEKDDKFYCEDDYYAAFNPKCGSCSEIIKGPYVSALDQSWHPEHFVCTHCKEPFGGNQFRKHDNKPYCEAHFEELFAPKCAQCGLGIHGQVFSALDQQYHLDCFKCAADGAPIGEGVSFHVHENRVYCESHFENLFLQRCHGCKDVIKGQFLKVLDHHFHSDCWKCVECATTLKAENCAVDGGEFYCKACMMKKRSAAPQVAAPPPKQVQQQMGANPQAVPSGVPTATAAPNAQMSDAAATEKAAASLAAIRARQAAEADAAAAAKAAAASGSPSSSSSPPSASAYADPSSKTYPYSLLKDKAARPADVDPARKERYLSDEEFQSLFKMDKDAFAKLPEWKQKAQKTPLMLF